MTNLSLKSVRMMYSLKKLQHLMAKLRSMFVGLEWRISLRNIIQRQFMKLVRNFLSRCVY